MKAILFFIILFTLIIIGQLCSDEPNVNDYDDITFWGDLV
jgi:hypothetical protein